jgi:hypothetical protein
VLLWEKKKEERGKKKEASSGVNSHYKYFTATTLCSVVFV